MLLSLMSLTQTDGLSQFYHIALPELLEMSSYMSVSSSPLDILHQRFLIKVMGSVGPYLLNAPYLLGLTLLILFIIVLFGVDPSLPQTINQSPVFILYPKFEEK